MQFYHLVILYVYIDIMLEKLKEHPGVCRMSGGYMGTIAYAGDIALLCPRIEGLPPCLMFVQFMQRNTKCFLTMKNQYNM